MNADKPEIGLVIRHMYLWRNEHLKGQEEGRKARPCLIIHTRKNDYNETEVFICPITHTSPRDPSHGKEIPLATKQRLKLDGQRSWVITHEVNRFTWKGFDVRTTERGEFAYGYLPHNFTQAVLTQLREHSRRNKLRVTDRDDLELLQQLRQRQFSTQTRDDDSDRGR